MSSLNTDLNSSLSPKGSLHDQALNLSTISSTIIALPPEKTTGHALSDEDRQRIVDLARQGIEPFRAALVETDRRSGGTELEISIVHSVANPGDPCWIGPELVAAIAEDKFSGPNLTLKDMNAGITGELGRHQIEFNFPPIFDFSGRSLAALEDQHRALWRLAQINAALFGAQPLASGIAATVLEDDFTTAHLPPKPRYLDAVAGLRNLHNRIPRFFSHASTNLGESTFVNIDSNGLQISSSRTGVTRIHSDSLVLELANTSIQNHWGVENQAHYVRDHRIADLIAPLLLGISTNSPIFAGRDIGVKEARLLLWIAGTHHSRVGLGPNWFKDPLEQFIRAADCGPFLEPAATSKSHDSSLDGIGVLLELAKTMWPINRTTPGKSEAPDGKVGYALRVEHRSTPIGPTRLDDVANSAFFYGLMAGMPDYLAKQGFPIDKGSEELEQALEFAKVHDNLYRAVSAGMQAEITWLNGERILINQLVQRDLLAVARQGLTILGVDPDLQDRYLGVIQEKVEFEFAGRTGWTPADISIELHRWIEETQADLDLRGKARMLVGLQLEMSEADMQAPEGMSAVQWFKSWVLETRAKSVRAH